MRLLAALHTHGPSSVSALAEHIGVDQPRASRLAQAAVEAGQVRRDVDPADARRSILVLTDAGRAALTSTLDRRRGAIEAALSGFSDAERVEFARLFTRFVEAWPRER
ncbi:MarR family transcriptional regulator [Agromyces sp. CFH 90414]|uniref:MarR family transcriptional regulator n=1 Tax=Agromyces agglutinans TaxID=2662258 RepID=A0A6I2F8H0_9MICO|nr:MarR family transcriptional regulator [Agromyces agglutinans]